MMKKKIPIGLKDYEKLKRDDYYVVDKSLLIKEYLDRGSEVTLITRPRRLERQLIYRSWHRFLILQKILKSCLSILK